mmetsp:Transcript_132778/g.424810  ORF Transcript_132778/g.424810 Transcript_132778/m.424810 type:complete len:406 (+) Transcript_132778:158-1375(+)
MRRRRGDTTRTSDPDEKGPVASPPSPIWQAFHRLCSLDVGSLHAFRIGLAVALSWDAMQKIILAPAFYERDASSYPLFALEEDVGRWAPWLNAFTWFPGALWPRALLMLTAFLAIAGTRLRCCTVACWVLVAMVTLRNVEVTFIFDRYIHFMLLFSSMLPYQDEGPNITVLLFRLQLAWIYFDAGYGKVCDSRGDWSFNAEVPALSVYMMGAPGLGKMLDLDRLWMGGFLVRSLTPFVAWVEVLVGPMALLSSMAPDGMLCVHFVPIAAAWSLHLGIALGMEGGPVIALVACASWMAVLPARVWSKLTLQSVAPTARRTPFFSLACLGITHIVCDVRGQWCSDKTWSVAYCVAPQPLEGLHRHRHARQLGGRPSTFGRWECCGSLELAECHVLETEALWPQGPMA